MNKSEYKHSKESRVIINELMLPSHSNFSGKIHGGYILSLMDQIAFACASKHSRAYCVTASVDTVDFLTPIDVGEIVTMKASVNYVGNTSMVIGIRVESENIRSGVVKHSNSSYFTMIARDEAGNNVKVPGLILQNEEDIRRFLKSRERKLMKRKRQNEFNERSFKLQDYKEELQNCRVLIDHDDF